VLEVVALLVGEVLDEGLVEVVVDGRGVAGLLLVLGVALPRRDLFLLLVLVL